MTLASTILSKTHLRGIGLVSAEWSFTESALELLIWEIGGIEHDKGYAITTHIGSETRIHILGALAEKRLVDPTLKKELSAIVAELRRLRTERNNIVHSMYLPKKTPSLRSLSGKGRKPLPQSIKITAKGKVVVSSKPIPSTEIFAIATQIGTLLTRMHNLVGKLRERTEEEKKKLREQLAAALADRQLVQGPGPKTTGHQSQ